MNRFEPEPEEPPIRFKDSRKIDPVTGQVRHPEGGSTPPPGTTPPRGDADPPEVSDVDIDLEAGGAPDENAQLLEERTRDLQRVSAEYANYRKRADRERLIAGEVAVGRTLAELLPVLDDLDRAKTHGDLTGGLKALADKLTTALDKLGLVSFGAVGDEFDPSMHEAVLHEESDTVQVPTCTMVMRVGYRHSDRLLRAAMVGVTDPTHPAPEGATDGPGGAADGDATQRAAADDATATGDAAAATADPTATDEHAATPDEENAS